MTGIVPIRRTARSWEAAIILCIGMEMLPIWVGKSEASSISLAIENVAPPRPLTHDFMKSYLDAFPIQAGTAKDLLIPKAQENTEIGTTQSPSFDHQEKDIPQSLFTWITIAKGFEVEWDTFGRKGWYSQDPRLKPIESGTVFMPEIPALYIVFEVAPLEDPAQFAVLWYLEQSDGKLKEVGKDALEVPGHERFGYLELKRPGERWATGKYLVKIYITSLGQQPFHAVNQVGTMHFTVTDTASPVHPEQKSSTIHGN